MKIRFNKHRPPKEYDARIDCFQKIDGGRMMATIRFVEDGKHRTVDLFFSKEEMSHYATEPNKLVDFLKLHWGNPWKPQKKGE